MCAVDAVDVVVEPRHVCTDKFPFRKCNTAYCKPRLLQTSGKQIQLHPIVDEGAMKVKRVLRPCALARALCPCALALVRQGWRAP